MPKRCVAALMAADLIIHAGDLITPDVLAQLTDWGETVAVHGNVDNEALRARLPERVELTVEHVRLGLLHDAGPSRGRLGRLRSAFPQAHAVIFGHSHIPLLQRDDASGLQIFNPGSPTDKRRQPDCTMGWAHVSGAEISFEILTV